MFDNPCFLSRVLSTVVKNAAATSDAVGEDRTASPSPPCGPNADLNQERTHQQREGAPGGLVGATVPPHVLPQDRTQGFQQDPAFDAPPPQVSPDAASTLRRIFTVLRNSCAGCPANNRALSHTGLAEAVNLLTSALTGFVHYAGACGQLFLHGERQLLLESGLVTTTNSAVCDVSISSALSFCLGVKK